MLRRLHTAARFLAARSPRSHGADLCPRSARRQAHSTSHAAVYLVLEEDNGQRVLMSRRWRTGFADGAWSLVAGHIHRGETVAAAAVREAREEVGIELREADLRVALVMHRPSIETNREYFDVYARASVWGGEPRNAEPDKCSSLAWHAPLDPPVDTLPFVRDALRVLFSGPTAGLPRTSQNAVAAEVRTPASRLASSSLATESAFEAVPCQWLEYGWHSTGAE